MQTYHPPYHFNMLENILYETREGLLLTYKKVQEAKDFWSTGLEDPKHAKMAIIGSVVYSHQGIEQKVVVSKGDQDWVSKNYLFDATQYGEFKNVSLSISEISDSFMMEDINLESTVSMLRAGKIERPLDKVFHILERENNSFGIKKETAVLPFDGIAVCLGSKDQVLVAKALGLVDSLPRRERSLFNLVMLAEIEWTRITKAYMELRQKMFAESSLLPRQEERVSGQGIVVLETSTYGTSPRFVAVRPLSTFLPFASYIQIMDSEKGAYSGFFDKNMPGLGNDIEEFLKKYTLRKKGFSPFVWHSVCSREGKWFAYRFNEAGKSLVIVRDIEMEVYRNTPACLVVDARWLLNPFKPGVPTASKLDCDSYCSQNPLDIIYVTKKNFCAAMEERKIDWLNGLYIKPCPVAKVDFSRIDCRTYPESRRESIVVKSLCTEGDIFQLPGLIRRVLLLAPKPCPESLESATMELGNGYWKPFIPALEDIRNFECRKRGFDYTLSVYNRKNMLLIEDNLISQSLFDWDFKPTSFRMLNGKDQEDWNSEDEMIDDVCIFPTWENQEDDEEFFNDYVRQNYDDLSEGDWREHVNEGHWND